MDQDTRRAIRLLTQRVDAQSKRIRALEEREQRRQEDAKFRLTILQGIAAASVAAAAVGGFVLQLIHFHG